jgi:ankyrin repeat protein
MLLHAGAQVDKEDEDCRTALQCAVDGGHGGLAEMLLHAGAQVDKENEVGQTAFGVRR